MNSLEVIKILNKMGDSIKYIKRKQKIININKDDVIDKNNH